jgi:type III restriction enzyme
VPEDRLTATFTTASELERTPELVGATTTRNQGIVGEPVDLTVTYS